MPALFNPLITWYILPCMSNGFTLRPSVGEGLSETVAKSMTSGNGTHSAPIVVRSPCVRETPRSLTDLVNSEPQAIRLPDEWVTIGDTSCLHFPMGSK